MSRLPFRLPEYVIEWIKDGTHVRVVEPNNGSDVQVKIDDVETTFGYGVVIVPPGTYVRPTLIVPPHIALLGCGRDSIIKLADGTNDAVIKNKNHYSLSGDANIVIGYLAIDGNGDKQSAFSIGISLKGTVDSIIVCCYVYDTYADGLGFWGAPKRCHIIGNLAKDCNKGAPGWNSFYLEGEPAGGPFYAEDCVIADNIGITAAGDGIHVDYVKRCTIEANVVSNDTTGILVVNSYDVTLVGNVVRDASSNGIKLNKTYYSVVDGNISLEHGSHGILIDDCTDITVSTNNCHNNTGDGIHLYSCTDITITANNCDNNTGDGIELDISHYCEVSVNHCYYDGLGILIGSSNYITVVGNTCRDNDDHGIRLYISQHCTVTGNTCVDNTNNGIAINDGNNAPYCRYNTIVGNTCHNNGIYGIQEWDSADYNVIVANNCMTNLNATLDISYTGSNSKVAWNLGRYSGQGDIREVWAPVTFGSPGLSQWDGHPGVTIDGSGEYCAVGLTVPEDYGSTVSVELLFIAHETAASQHLTINVYWGKVGEQRNNHFSGGPNRDLGAVTNGQIHAHDVSDLLSPLEAGDVVGFYIEYSSTAVDSNVFILGVRFRYQNKNA